MDKSGNEFLDMANDILEGEGADKQISLAKQINEKKEFIAVVIYRGTKKEIEAMAKDG